MDWTFTVIRENFAFFMRGLLVTFELTLLIMAIGIILGLVLALMRHSHTWYLRYPSMLAIEAVRGTPVIMLVFWFFFLLAGIALFVLRRKEPHIERPFRVPLYPVTPMLFCSTCAYLLYSSLAYTGTGALVGVAVLAAGALLLLFMPGP